MANIRKTFNFRNGVQVDDDNLVVNPLGLVGIGTTIPTESLDVRGTAKVVGLVTADQVYTPSLTATTATIQNLTLGASIVGGGVSISSGIITASGSGVVTYYGDGGRLLNLPTSQWLDVDVGLGFTSIYARGFVGVQTNDPRYAFQIAGSNDLGTFTNGVGIDSTGNIRATGIVTANQFSGIGSNLTLINADNISSGTISTDRIPQLPNSKLPTNINSSGIITASGGFSGNLTGNVTGSLTGNVTGIASTARSLTGNPDILVNNVTATSIAVTSITNVTSIGGTNINLTGIATVSRLNVGVGGTAVTMTSDSRIGIGSANPTEALQIISNQISTIEVVGTESRLILAEEKSGVGIANSAGVIRYGNSNDTFELLNYAPGNFNLYLHSGAGVGINTGRFAWVYGQNFSEIMSLTYDGYLGIGITNPRNTVHVVGTSTVTGNSWIGGNLGVSGNLTVSGTINGTVTLPPVFNGNVNSISGISTFSNVTVSSGSSIGIGTGRPTVGLDARDQRGLFSSIGLGTDTFYGSELLGIDGSVLISQGNVGIGTTYIDPAGAALQLYTPLIDFNDGHLNIESDSTIGFNTVFPRAIFDFGNVGSATTRPVMVVPNISSSTRNGIGQTPTGAIVFNTSTSKFQGYTGVAWTDFH